MIPFAPGPPEELESLGAVLTPDLIERTYAVMSVLTEPEDDTCRAEFDIRYGADERNLLDLYLPSGGRPVRAVFVYVHGGGFSAGGKGGADARYYGNIGRWAARNGLAGVAMTYRLAPAARWPAGAEDVGRAVDWITENKNKLFDGATDIILAGQSAGAVHVAGYLGGHDGARSRNVSAALLMSGIYDFARHDPMGFEAAYFGDGPGNSAEHATVGPLLTCGLPVLFTVSELDPPQFQRQAGHVVEAALDRTGHWPRMHYLAGHNHISPALHIGAQTDTVGPLLTAFVNRILTRKRP